MSSDYDDECYRKPATEMTVRPFAGDRPGTRQAGPTRPAGVVARGDTNERASGLASFKGRELIRRANSR